MIAWQVAIRTLAGALLVAATLPGAAQRAGVHKEVLRPHATVSGERVGGARRPIDNDVLRDEVRSGGRLVVDGRPVSSVQDYLYGVGRGHFPDFERRVDSHAVNLLEKSAGTRPDYFIQLYAVVSYSYSPLMVKFSRLAESGDLETVRVILPRRNMPLEEAYAYAFGSGREGDPSNAAFIREFRRMPLLVDSSLFHELAGGDVRGNRPAISMSPNHALHSGQKVSVWWNRPNHVAAEFDLYAAKNQNGSDIYYPIVGRPKLLGRLPPQLYANHAHALSKSKFDQKSLSILLMEDSVDASRAVWNSGLSLASNATKLERIGSGELADLESKFAVRRGKTIAVIGHYEKESFHIRSGTRIVGSIQRATLDEWSKRYGVDLLLLGCLTASERPTGMLETVTELDPYSVARNLSRAAADATNWGEFIARLSSEEMPLVLGTEPSERDIGLSVLTRRLPNGRLYPVALAAYRLQCALLNWC